MRYAPPEERAPRRIVPVVILAILGVFALAVGALAIRAKVVGQSITTATVNLFVPSPETKFGKDRILMLIVGLDYDYDAKDQESSKNARTDSILAAALDFPTRTFRLVSVPRDMQYFNKLGKPDKINAAYAEAGSNYYGTDRAVGKFLGLPSMPNNRYFDRHVALRINAAKDLVDAIGGIDVPVTETMNYDDSWGHLHIHFKPGVKHMTGEEAVSYSRFRHDACSDPCRIKRQQQVIKLMIAKLKENKFNDISHIRELTDIVRKDVITDLNADEMTSLAVGFANTQLADVKMTQVPYVSDIDTPNGNLLVPDEKKRDELVATNLLGAFATSAPAVKPDLSRISPRLVRVDVENGSGTLGLATKMASALKKRGFVVAAVGNAQTYDHETTEIHTHSKLAGAGEYLREQLKLATATVLVDPGTEAAPSAAPAGASAPNASDVTVIVGRDYAAALVKTTALVP